MQETAPDTGVVLQESLPSNEFGRFTFPEPLTPGSIVKLKDSAKGLHGGAPYQGMLRRVVAADAKNPLVVSPLTTLLANGIAPEELIAAFHNAGLTGLSISDLYADPMDGLAGMTTGVTDQDLELLQASMAVDAYLEIAGAFGAGLNGLNDPGHFEIFSTMLNTMQNLLNPGEFANITGALANDPDVPTPLILEDFILAVLAEQRTIVALAQEGLANNNTFDPAMVVLAEQDAMNNSVANVKFYYNQRVPPSTVHDGATLYHVNCAGCHQPLDVTEKPGRTEADIQSAIDNNIGGMGALINMTPGEVAAIADIRRPLLLVIPTGCRTALPFTAQAVPAATSPSPPPRNRDAVLPRSKRPLTIIQAAWALSTAWLRQRCRPLPMYCQHLLMLIPTLTTAIVPSVTDSRRPATVILIPQEPMRFTPHWLQWAPTVLSAISGLRIIPR